MKNFLVNYYKINKNSKSKLTALIVVTLLCAFLIVIILNSKQLMVGSEVHDYRDGVIGKSEYVIDSKTGSMFSKNDITYASNNIKELSIVYASGLAILSSNEINVNFYSCKIDNYFEVFSSSKLISGNKDYTKAKNSIIISKSFSKKNNIDVGGVLKVDFNSNEEEFNVIGIISGGAIGKEKNSFLIDISTLQNLMKINNDKVNKILIYSEVNRKISINDISSTNSDLYIHEAMDNSSVDSIASVTLILSIFFITFIFVISLFILYTTYKIKLNEQIKIFGTFRTLGATNKQLIYSYVLFNIIITCIAAFISCLFGQIVVLILASSMNAKIGILSILFTSFLTIFIMCCLTFVSTYFSMINLLKNNDKDLVTDNEVKIKKDKFKLDFFISIAGIILAIIGIVCKLGIIATLIFLILIIISFMRLVILIVDLCKKISGKIQNKGFGVIAFKNVSGNVYLNKNIGAISIISILLCIVCLIMTSTTYTLTKFYGDYRCNAGLNSQVEFVGEIKNDIINQVGEDNCYFYSAGSITLDSSQSVSYITLDNVSKYNDSFFNLRLVNNSKYNLSDFNSDKFVIITKTLANRYNYKLGDKVILSSNGIKDSYTIFRISKTIMNNGDIIFISKKDIIIPKLTQEKHVMLKTKNYNQVKNLLIKKYPAARVSCSVYKEKMKDEESNFKTLSLLMYVFVALITLITLFGIINNYKMSYTAREKEFVILSSVGYENKDIFKILGLETLFVGIISSILGILCSLVILPLIKRILLLVDLDFDLTIGVFPIIFTIICCIFTSSLGLFFSRKKIKKNNLKGVELLKI